MSNEILEHAQLLIDEEHYDKAYELLSSNFENLKNDADFLEKIALTAKMLDKPDDVQKYFEELVKINPNSLIAYSELLDIYESKDKFKYYVTRAKYKILNEKVTQAIDDYKKALNNTQNNDEIINVRFLLAKVYEASGKVQNAIDEYYRIIEHKNDMAIYYKLADLYCSINDRFSAIDILIRGVKAFPDVDELSEYLCRLYISEGEYNKAIQYARNDYSKIKSYLMNGDNDEALKLLNEINDENNANYPALFAEYYFNIGDLETCSSYIDKFATLSPQNPLVFQMRALVCDKKDDSFGYHYNMGRCYSFKEDYELALNEYLIAHRIDSSTSEPIKEIIKINETSGDKTSLMEFYEKLYRQEPNNTIALEGLGNVYFDLYEFSYAIDYFEKFVKLNTSDYEVFKKLGFCYEKIKQTSKAKENYEKYLQKAPLSDEVEKIKEKVSKMPSPDKIQDESNYQEEGFLDKIMKLFGK